MSNKNKFELIGLIFGVAMFGLIFIAAYFSYNIGSDGYFIMGSMFFASFFDNISRKCFEYSKINKNDLLKNLVDIRKKIGNLRGKP